MKQAIALSLLLLVFLNGQTALSEGSFRIKRADSAEESDNLFSRTVVRSKVVPERVTSPEETSLYARTERNNWTDTFTNLAPPPAQPPRTASVNENFSFPNVPVITRLLSPNELNRLAGRDVVVVIDKSGSMSERDCPGDRASLTRLMPALISGGFAGGAFNGGSGLITRWEWCARQTIDLARQTSRLSRQNLSIVLFDSRDRVYENTSLSSIPLIFQSNRPSGGTNAVGALKRQLNAYFARRDRGQTKPLLIAVITDGAPDSPGRLKELIAETTTRMQSPDEIIITFLQIGNDPNGYRLLQDLDHGARMTNAVYDIVETRSFPELMRQGLAHSLVRAVSKNQQSLR